MDLSQAKDRALYLMTYGLTKTEAISKAAFEMSQSQAEFDEIVAGLGQMELVPDAELSDAELSALVTHLEMAQVTDLIEQGLTKDEAIEKVCRKYTDTTEEFNKLKSILEATFSE